MSTTTETQTPAPAAAKKAPAKATKAAPAKAPAKKAAPTPTATAPAKKAAAPAGAKLRWVVEGDRNQAGGKEQSARVGDRLYEITRSDEGWTATVTVDGGKPDVLSDTTFAKAYTACVAHNRAN